ncbi:MAG: hypothetical protein L6408_02320 [Nanoarchaeota archaeon]|nr:hypothetical protein [Nanoarchaeota archaeon]
MKIPETFRTGKEHIEKLIKKAVVKETLAKDLGEQVKKYLEQNHLAEKLEIKCFKKIAYSDVSEDLWEIEEELETAIKKDQKPTLVKKIMPETYVPITNEMLAITTKLIELYPTLKESEINIGKSSFSVITDDVAYVFHYRTAYTGNIEEKIEDIDDKFVRTIYQYRNFKGIVKYANFNKEHNEKLVQALKDCGYDVYISILEEKKK